MTGWHAVVHALKSEGIKFVYGLPAALAIYMMLFMMNHP